MRSVSRKLLFSEGYIGMDKRKIPLVLMLIAGSTACIITFVCNYDTLDRLVILFCVLLLFYCLGAILKWTLERFEKEIEKEKEKKKQDEGSVIEKEAEDIDT